MKLFITGATGYIGGDFLFAAVKAHPEWDISCLVRDSGKASTLSERYPRVRVVLGDLDSTSMIEDEAASCDVVYHMANCDHTRSAQAIARGLARNRHGRAYWIHTSGAGILTHQNFAHNTYGSTLPSDTKIYDDWDNIAELTSLPDKALHRHVDKIVLATSADDKIKTAIVSPPCIYGSGRGTGNTSSVQVHVAARVSLAAGKGLQVGDGSNIWHEVHIEDLSALYVLLGEAASTGGGRASWNRKGYYLAESGSFTWGEVAQRVAREGLSQRLLKSSAVESVDAERSKTHHPFFPYLCGTTSRGVSKRARLLLGWTPRTTTMLDDIGRIVRDEAVVLGLRAASKGDSLL